MLTSSLKPFQLSLARPLAHSSEGFKHRLNLETEKIKKKKTVLVENRLKVHQCDFRELFLRRRFGIIFKLFLFATHINTRTVWHRTFKRTLV
jgi:hypothetical protein